MRAAGAVQLPDAAGRFGKFGGRFVPETLMHALDELDGFYESVRGDREFEEEYARLLSALRRAADAAVPRGEPERRAWRGADIPQA